VCGSFGIAESNCRAGSCIPRLCELNVALLFREKELRLGTASRL